MTATFDLGAEVSAATAQQQAAIKLGRAQMAQEILEELYAPSHLQFADSVNAIITLCEKEAAK